MEERPEINNVQLSPMNYQTLPLIAFTVGLKEANFTIGDNNDTPDTVLFDYEALVSIFCRKHLQGCRG